MKNKIKEFKNKIDNTVDSGKESIKDVMVNTEGIGRVGAALGLGFVGVSAALAAPNILAAGAFYITTAAGMKAIVQSKAYQRRMKKRESEKQQFTEAKAK